MCIRDRSNPELILNQNASEVLNINVDEEFYNDEHFTSEEQSFIKSMGRGRKITKGIELVDKLTPKDILFEQFYTLYPIMVSRPDGTKGFLRSNVKKCRDYYNKLVKGNPDLHNRIITALNFELSDKAMTGKLGYMKTMWKWLTSHEWELIEEQMNINQPETTMLYGTKLR